MMAGQVVCLYGPVWACMGLYGPQQLFAILLLLCRNTDFAAYNLRLVGVWRSLVAHLHGVQGVEGSNPFTPTIDT